MGQFPTGVTVVTGWGGEEPLGSTINAFCSVSLQPPMLLICLDHRNPLLAPVRETGVFGLNILGADDGEALARRFATGPTTGRFEGLSYDATPGGAPRLPTAPVFVDCACVAIHDAGDHAVVIARGLRLAFGSAEAPLLYHRGAFPLIGAVS